MNSAKQPARDVIAARRERVSFWRVRGLSTRAISAKLADEKLTNPRTEQPWDHDTITDDCKALLHIWQRSAQASTEARVAAQLAEYAAVRAAAWEAGDFNVIIRALKQEAELLGLNAPTKMDIELRIRQHARSLGFDEDEAVREAQSIIEEWRRATAR